MDINQKIKALSTEFGFIDCGVSKARRLDEEEFHLQQWLENKFQGKMQYMENHFEKRLDPTLLVPGAKSIISFLYNYFPVQRQNASAPKISKYAYGRDYHKVMKDKLHLLVEKLKAETGDFQYRVFVDSAPVMERQWAALSGLGWIGKNSLLLRKSEGSFFFIGNIVCDLELEPDSPTTDHCGTCTACIDACPTQAIIADSVIDATKCISYLTIELKEPIADSFSQQMEGWAYGCDICQDVCPWNRFSTANPEPELQPTGEWLQWDWQDWQNMNPAAFESNFAQSAITRAGYTKLQSNLEAVAKQHRKG